MIPLKEEGRLLDLGGARSRIEGFAERPPVCAPSRRCLVEVVAGTLGAEAPLLGAAELAFEPVLADPALWLNRSDVDPAETPMIAVRRVVA